MRNDGGGGGREVAQLKKILVTSQKFSKNGPLISPLDLPLLIFCLSKFFLISR